MRDETLLFVHVPGEAFLEATIETVNKTNSMVIFTIEGKYMSEDIEQLTIMRNNETLVDIHQHLAYGRRHLGHDIEVKAVLQSRYLAPIFGLSPVESVPRPIARRRIDYAPPNAGKTTRAIEKRRFTRYAQLRTETLTSLIPHDLKSANFTSLNDRQRCSVASQHWMSIIEGYPGTGKTKSAAAYILVRFQALLLEERSGWMVALTSTNASALNILDHVQRYPSLRPFIVHAYSGSRRAFDKELFEPAYPYRMTPKKRLQRHGILICTIGSLRTVVRKYQEVGWHESVRDLFTDESGQLWTTNALLFLPRFPNLQRWQLGGDTAQLSPYVAKMAPLDHYFPSVMNCYNQVAVGTNREESLQQFPLSTVTVGTNRVESLEQFTLSTVTVDTNRAEPLEQFTPSPESKDDFPLVVYSSPEPNDDFPLVVYFVQQYRMNLDLCKSHAPVFYDYEIETMRKTKANARYDGLYIVTVPRVVCTVADFRERNREMAVKKALAVLAQIQVLNLQSASGTPYTYAILTPYRNMVSELQVSATACGLLNKKTTIATVDCIQGCEYNAVIYVPGVSTCVDLCRCRHRGNVAMSRAKDIFVLVLHKEFALSTKVLTESTFQLRFWGQYLSSPMVQRFDVRDDIDAKMLLGELRLRAGVLNKSAYRAGGLFAQTLGQIQRTVNEQKTSKQDRDYYAYLLCLKQKPHRNKDFHFNLYLKFRECERLVFLQALDIMQTHGKPNKALHQALEKFFGIRQFDHVSDKQKQDIIMRWYDPMAPKRSTSTKPRGRYNATNKRHRGSGARPSRNRRPN